MTRPSPEPDSAVQPTATRRDVLLLAGAASALVADVGEVTVVVPNEAAERGQPFGDGTYFDDGYGWVD